MTGRSRGIAVALLAGALAAAAAPVRASVPPSPDPLAAEVEAVRAAGAVGVLARTAGPEGVRTASAGAAELGTDRPVPAYGRFRVGSNAKTFTAVVVLQLVAERRLSLDDPVERVLPGVVTGNGNDGRLITVRQLLQHTSGVYDHLEDQDAFPQRRSAAEFRALRLRAYTDRELVDVAMRHPPVFAPGTSFGYSNTNYVLAGMIIERLTGATWQEEVTRRVIRPLGLSETTAPEGDPYIRGPHPRGYRTFPDEPGPVDVTVQDQSFAGAAGGIVGTARDLQRFFTALAAGRLLPPGMWDEMRRTVPTRGDLAEAWPGSRYGLGLLWIPSACGGYWTHNGDTFGYTTRLGVTPDARRFFALAVTGTVGEEAEAAANRLADRALCP